MQVIEGEVASWSTYYCGTPRWVIVSDEYVVCLRRLGALVPESVPMALSRGHPSGLLLVPVLPIFSPSMRVKLCNSPPHLMNNGLCQNTVCLAACGVYWFAFENVSKTCYDTFSYCRGVSSTENEVHPYRHRDTRARRANNPWSRGTSALRRDCIVLRTENGNDADVVDDRLWRKEVT